jgi:hypothetical protein
VLLRLDADQAGSLFTEMKELPDSVSELSELPIVGK